MIDRSIAPAGHDPIATLTPDDFSDGCAIRCDRRGKRARRQARLERSFANTCSADNTIFTIGGPTDG